MFRQIRYYLENQEALLNTYAGLYLIIQDDRVVETFPTREEAYNAAFKKFAPGTFIVQHCVRVN